MPYIAHQLDRFLGTSVGSGQCVAFVEAAAHTPIANHWKQGEKVRNNLSIQTGTAIANIPK